MKVLVRDGRAVSEYPDYISEETLFIDKNLNPGAKLYRVAEGTNVMRDDSGSLQSLVNDDGSPGQSVQSVELKGPMTEAEIQAISL